MPRLATLRSAGVVSGISILMLFAACNNIWEWTAESDSFDVIMSDGREALRAAEYARAEELFGRAVELRPDHSEARYYYAKAAVLDADVNVFTLVQVLTDRDSEQDGASTVFNYEIPVANSIYRVNGVVLDNLEPIRQGEATEGTFSGVDVDLDNNGRWTFNAAIKYIDSTLEGQPSDGDAGRTDFDPTIVGFGFGYRF